MSPEKAESIIDALANGIDPKTGEVLSDQSIFNNPHIIRALFLAKKALDDLIRKQKREKELPSNAEKLGQNMKMASYVPLLIVVLHLKTLQLNMAAPLGQFNRG